MTNRCNSHINFWIRWSRLWHISGYLQTSSATRLADNSLSLALSWKATSCVEIFSKAIACVADQRKRHKVYGEVSDTCEAECLPDLECIVAVGFARVFAAALDLTAHFNAIVTVNTAGVYTIVCRDLCTIIKISLSNSDNITIRSPGQFGMP